MEHTSEELRSAMSPFLGQILWYWNCVEKAKLLDPRNRFCEMGKTKDPPAQDVAYSARESIYEAFWRTMVCDIDTLDNRPIDLTKSFQVFHETHSSLGHIRDMIVNAELGAEFESFSNLVYAYKSRRKFFTPNSLLGPPRTETGGFVCIISGVRLPYISANVPRREPDYIEFELIGEADVHDVMDGEAFMDSETSPVRGAKKNKKKIVLR